MIAVLRCLLLSPLLLVAACPGLEVRRPLPPRWLKVQIQWKQGEVYPAAVGWSMTVYCGPLEHPGDPFIVGTKEKAESGEFLAPWPASCGDQGSVRLTLEMNEKRGCPSPALDPRPADVRRPLVVPIPCEARDEP